MSGIVGIYYLDGRPVEGMDVQRMIDSIAHRGPDGCGVWTDGSVGLGHRMLWTTPESLHEKLPLTNKSGDLTITADARIDNRDELISALNFNGRLREAIADSEIILAAYEKWDERCAEKLLGDFSFAIWDKRRQRIYCARDPIGIKPFFYFFDGKTFRWASEPKPIFEDPAIAKEANFNLICLYLLNRFDEREETLYKNIYRLPSSQSMVLENGHLRKGQYWDVDPNHAIRYRTDEEYAEHFLELFKEAVRVRLRSHGPVGAMLSGGLDSSSIVCTAQLLYRQKSIPNNGFETFSLIFDQLPCDERKYINETIRKWDIRSNYFTYENNLDSVDFEQAAHYSDVGYFPTLISYAPSFRAAYQRGIRTMLYGIGGDDLLAAGFEHLTDLFLQGRIYTLIGKLRQDAALFSYSIPYLFFNYCLKTLVPQSLKLTLKQLRKPLYGSGIPPWVRIAYLRKNGGAGSIKTTARITKFPTRSQQNIYEGLFYGWNANISLDMIERFTSHFSMESRHPFLDQRLTKFLIAVPEEQRWDTKWPKAILRNAMSGTLPESTRLRDDKAEFSCIVNQEFGGRQASKVEELIRTSVFAMAGIIDSEKLKELFEDYRVAMSKDQNMRISLELFVWLELWYRSVFNRHEGGKKR